jgi:hypothetical protein
MLGHASAAMTLDVYAGLFAEDLDDVAERLKALVPSMPRRPERPLRRRSPRSRIKTVSWDFAGGPCL